MKRVIQTLTSIWRAQSVSQSIGNGSWLWRFKACLPRWRCKVDVDLWWRHCVGLTELIQSGEWLCALILVDAHVLLLAELVVHIRLEAKALRHELGQRLLLGNETRRDGRTMARTDVRAIVQVELIELRDGVLEELRIGLCVEIGRSLCVLEAIVCD